MIREIDHFQPELQAALFLESEILHQRDVEVVRTRTVQKITTCISEYKHNRWSRKCGRIEVSIDRPFTLRQVAVTDAIRPIAAAGIGVVYVQTGRERATRLKCFDRGKLPPAEKTVDQCRGVGQETPSGAEGQFINH